MSMEGGSGVREVIAFGTMWDSDVYTVTLLGESCQFGWSPSWAVGIDRKACHHFGICWLWEWPLGLLCELLALLQAAHTIALGSSLGLLPLSYRFTFLLHEVRGWLVNAVQFYPGDDPTVSLMCFAVFRITRFHSPGMKIMSYLRLQRHATAAYISNYFPTFCF